MSANEGDFVRRPTIYDIAKRAGTSPSAVSSVLNGSWQKRRISRKLADRITRVAEELGYSANLQASLLRREKSNVVGMIVPKYDNRYFGTIAEQFEILARARGLFPMITCTQREPALEIEAAKEILSFQVDCLVATGATDPDRITLLCRAAGVRSINVDLPGTLAPSVISDNHAGARDLTRLLLDRCERDLGWIGALHFVGGRLSDHNTAARLKGFRDAHAERGIDVPDANVLAHGYSAAKAERDMAAIQLSGPGGIFINSTIALEGAVRSLRDRPDVETRQIRYACFDWDPFAALLPGNVGMVEQDVTAMLTRAFELMNESSPPLRPMLVPCILMSIGSDDVTAPRRHRCATVGLRGSTEGSGHVRDYHGRARSGQERIPGARG
jgi:DNA-binding LacI/PurR family transcriptional regulator